MIINNKIRRGADDGRPESADHPLLAGPQPAARQDNILLQEDRNEENDHRGQGATGKDPGGRRLVKSPPEIMQQEEMMDEPADEDPRKQHDQVEDELRKILPDQRRYRGEYCNH